MIFIAEKYVKLVTEFSVITCDQEVRNGLILEKNFFNLVVEPGGDISDSQDFLMLINKYFYIRKNKITIKNIYIYFLLCSNVEFDLVDSAVQKCD